ncbi:hypothetical protein Tsubulata_007895 [Turnera subulata]|uniref:Homeobox domain-containing protein n=1 Tax=Turnera subulata TaxID=218843 RepID=A0A9Q0FN26_9ROSI|nr:hypothetical protein Tsubulata_007895 [Turnera subulata]
MEGDLNMDMVDHHQSDSTESAAPVRWNPTKEQIIMLENLYRQGMRTPSAEQIQQITSRLKAYGHIEGKNVFYWFQNHKARQRLKQKQESMACINHYLCPRAAAHHQPVFAPPNCQRVACSPHYHHQQPQSDLGLYPEYHMMMLPSVKRRARAQKLEGTRASYAFVRESASANECNNPILMAPNARRNRKSYGDIKGNCNYKETLPLFPLLPTGMSGQISTTRNSFGSSSTENSISTPSSSSDTANGIEEGFGSGGKPFFDFLSAGHDPFLGEY